MSLFKRGKSWWYEFNFQGVRFRESTHTPDRELAGRIERERRRKLEAGKANLTPVSRPVTVAKAVSDFLEENDDWAPRTLGIHANSWRHLKPHFGGMLLQDITPLEISRYRK